VKRFAACFRDYLSTRERWSFASDEALRARNSETLSLRGDRDEIFPFVPVAASERSAHLPAKIIFVSTRAFHGLVMDVPFFGTRGSPSREDNRGAGKKPERNVKRIK